jgi:hypothetical protein
VSDTKSLDDIGLKELPTSGDNAIGLLSKTEPATPHPEKGPRISVDKTPGAKGGAEDLIETEAAEAASEAETPAEETAETEKPTSEAELKRQEMEARLAKLREDQVERRKTATLTAEQQRIQKIQEQLASQYKSLEGLGIKPGMSEREIYEAVTKRHLAASDPEIAKELQQKAEQDAIKERDARIERLEKELAQDRAYRSQQAAESQFLGIVKDPSYEILHDIYDEGELINLGNQVASAWLQQGHTQWSVKDIADTIKNVVEKKLQRLDERRNARKKPTEDATKADAPKASSVSKATSKTLSNKMAGPSSASPNGQNRQLTKKEREAAAAALIE